MEMQEIVSQAVRLSFSSVDQSTTPAKIFCLTVNFYQPSLILFYLQVTNKRKMRSILSIVMLICLVSAINFQPSHSSSHQKPGFQLKGLIQKGLDGLEELRDKHAVGKDVISSRKLGLGLKFKAILLKPLLLVVLAKIKLALLLGKPLALLALKKLLLKGVLGKLLLKIPLILLGGKAVLLAKVLALKFALITKGLIGLKAPLALLFLGGFLKGALKGSGLGLALGLAGSLLKQTGHGSSGEEYDEPAYYAPPAYGQILPPPPPPSYGAAVPYSEPLHLHAPPAYSSAPVYSAPASQSQYTQESSAYYGSEHSGYGRYDGGRKKRNGDDSEEEEEVEDSEEEFSEESPEELRLEIEAARTNVHAYLYMAAQFDEQSCGRRLMCEVYQKPQGSHTEDELILQDIFGYPLPALSEEDQGTPKELYYRAAQLGVSHQGRPNNQICARVYASCPHNSEQLIQYFISEDVETNEIDLDDNRPVSHLQPPQQQSTARLPFYHHRPSANVTPVQQWKPAIVRPAVHIVKQQPQEQIRRPTVAATPVAPLRKRFGPAAV